MFRTQSLISKISAHANFGAQSFAIIRIKSFSIIRNQSGEKICVKVVENKSGGCCGKIVIEYSLKSVRSTAEILMKEGGEMDTERLLSKKIGYCIFGFMGFWCALLWKAEHDLAAGGNLIWNGSYIGKLLAFSMLGVLAGVVICAVVYRTAEHRGILLKRQTAQDVAQSAQKVARAASVLTPGKVFWLSLLMILLCWLPCYLAYYPGICSYDTTIQLSQITDNTFIDHHPIAHTLLLQGAITLGNTLFGSANEGIAVWVAVQMVFFAAVFAYALMQVYRFRVKRGWMLCLALYSMLYPFHWYMSVTTTKDTWFGAFFLMQMISLCVMLARGERTTWFSREGVLFLNGTIGMVVFRNNGRYAVLVLLLFLLLTVWRGKKRRRLYVTVFAYTVVGLLLGCMITSALYRLTDAQQGDRREMLSMPIQQLARCMVYHGGIGVVAEDDNTMRPEHKAIINDFLLDESYREYRPDISDPVKRHTNTYVVRYRAKEFITTYLELLLQYPGDFINAVLATNAGYLTPGDVSHATINVNGRDRGLGYVQTRWVDSVLNPQGIYKASKWEGLHEVLENWADENAYLNIPILKYLFVPGTYLWFYLLLAGALLVRRRWHMLLPLSLVLGYFATLLLGPTVQLRYLYPIMIVAPFVVPLSFAREMRQSDGEIRNGSDA